MSDSNGSSSSASARTGRPPIGPRIDFRVPADASAIVKEWATNVGRTEDAVCREVFLRGIESALAVRAYRRRAATRPVDASAWTG